MADPLHILVVDADAARREACVAMLRALGHRVDDQVAPVGAMGRLVDRIAPVVNLLVVAGDLPGMGPVLLMRAARSLPGRADLPVVVVGGNADLAGQAHCMRIDAATGAALEQALVALATRTEPPSGTARRVLVVDDHEINRVLPVKALESLGLKVDTAVDGIDALAKAGRQPYGLVFMDVEMPRMDGLEATRAIRHMEKNQGRHTPIVACTSRNLPGDREAGMAAGMDDYLVKPITRELLAAQVERWLGAVARKPVVSAVPPPAVIAPPTATAPPALTAVPPLLDREVFERIKGYGAEVLASTAGQFLKELNGRLAELERLAAAEDCEGLYKHAHGLKGVAGSLGAKRLWQAMAAIEAAGRAKDLAKALELMASMRPLAQASADAMRAAMGN